MIIVSSMASQSWESADETVKAEYRRIAKEALSVRIKGNKHMESKDTSPFILDTFSHNINSIPDHSFEMYSNTTFTNNPFLYEMYLVDTDFNANNPFNYQSPNLTSINTLYIECFCTLYFLSSN
ncbi:hypothetical protein F8M41_018954 [Gigaspora margarita]|uniref:Uncharacterized protein n=1 Tax=Gigaspora margarita TaxID=4874 RepID=A0A8H4AKS2_GIGMA|nr:hypothetical protein F8M41_018954 [Gigaspora margarita]